MSYLFTKEDMFELFIKAMFGFLIGFLSVIAVTETFTRAVMLSALFAGVRTLASTILILLKPRVEVASGVVQHRHWTRKVRRWV